jgi:hypothetical protein
MHLIFKEEIMSKLVKSLVAGFVLSMSMSVFAADAAMTADAQALNTACASEAQTAGCGSDKVGKCIHEYKEKNPSFKVSDGCRDAMKKMHADKKAGM